MRITDESADGRLGNAEIVVRVDPHDGTCHGAHDIVIAAFRAPAFDDTHPEYMHVTLSWGASVVLSIRGSQEFEEGLNTALGIARTIRATGKYIAPDMTIDMTISKIEAAREEKDG